MEAAAEARCTSCGRKGQGGTQSCRRCLLWRQQYALAHAVLLLLHASAASLHSTPVVNAAGSLVGAAGLDGGCGPLRAQLRHGRTSAVCLPDERLGCRAETSSRMASNVSCKPRCACETHHADAAGQLVLHSIRSTLTLAARVQVGGALAGAGGAHSWRRWGRRGVRGRRARRFGWRIWAGAWWRRRARRRATLEEGVVVALRLHPLAAVQHGEALAPAKDVGAAADRPLNALHTKQAGKHDDCRQVEELKRERAHCRLQLRTISGQHPWNSTSATPKRLPHTWNDHWLSRQ